MKTKQQTWDVSPGSQNPAPRVHGAIPSFRKMHCKASWRMENAVQSLTLQPHQGVLVCRSDCAK